MTTHKSYAECKIAHPDSEIVTTGKNWAYDKELAGTFQPRVTEGCSHAINDYSWVICNPEDYCSSIKEFFDAKLTLDVGDKIIDKSGKAHDVNSWISYVACEKEDGYILSVDALNGGCKIPSKAEQWTVYNNTMPLCELTDEQVGKLVKHSGCVEHMNPNSGDWAATITPMWNRAGVYRIKPKSERELFIDKSVGLMTSETERTMEKMFGAQFDAGARYTDKTQFFGESI